MGRRSYPGRLTFEEWQAVPFRKRLELIKRAQCDLLGSFRFRADKRCRRRERAAAAILTNATSAFGGW